LVERITTDRRAALIGAQRGCVALRPFSAGNALGLRSFTQLAAGRRSSATVCRSGSVASISAERDPARLVLAQRNRVVAAGDADRPGSAPDALLSAVESAAEQSFLDQCYGVEALLTLCAAQPFKRA
jgi:hypothetical protein